jgi:very-short-patch-repair endonuclease
METPQPGTSGVISIGAALTRIGLAEGTPAAGLPWADGDPWRAVYDKCESPIERLMCLGIHGFLGYEARDGLFRGARSLPEDRRAGALVYGQHSVGNYRADFLVVGFVRGEKPIKIIVECDGRKFHNPALDAERDELIRSAFGIETVRFTGYEIHRRLPDVIGRIPARMGRRYSWTIAAEYGFAPLTEMVDALEDGESVRSPVDDPTFEGDDGGNYRWADTL